MKSITQIEARANQLTKSGYHFESKTLLGVISLDSESIATLLDGAINKKKFDVAKLYMWILED